MIARWSARLHQRRPGLSRVVTSMAWLSLDRAMRMIFGFTVGVFMARHLGPERFGELNFALVFAWLFGAVSKLGLDRILVRDLVRHPERTPQLLGSAFVLRAGGGVIAMISAVAAIWMIRPHDRSSQVLVAIVSLAFALDAFETIEFYFQSQVAAKYSVWARNVALVMMSTTRIVLVKIDAPLVAYAWTQVGESLIACVALMVLNRRFGVPISRWKPNGAVARRLLADSWPQLLSAMAIMIYMRIDAVMLREMSGEREVGIYAAATRISELWYVIPLALLTAVLPSVVRVRESNRALYNQRLLHLFSLMSAISLTLAVPIALFATPLINAVYGNRYTEAGPVLAVHIWASIFVFLGTAQETWNVAEGLIRLSFYRTVAGALINVALNVVLIPRYGSLGAAWATVVAYAFAAVISNLFSVRTRPIFVLQMKSLFFPRYLFLRP
ncbi:MAG: Polysaccharide transporter, family [Phycisphaerales bacterium]|nr:Polysaccharide transporter, family [Phycisphaerales bacterium]